MKIRLYNIDDKFNFGRNCSKTVRELLEVNPGYVDWVIRNVDSFALSHDAFQQAKIITEGKRFSKNEVVELSKEKQNFKILSEKLYGWDYDFSKEDILQINNMKINQINSNLEKSIPIKVFTMIQIGVIITMI